MRLKNVLEKVLCEDILDYITENNRIKNKLQLSSYENAKNILERCATYLLLGQFHENNILTLNKIRKYYDNEIPASSSDSNAYDLIYSSNETHEELTDVNLSAGSEKVRKEPQKNKTLKSLMQIESDEKRQKKRYIKYKKSKTYRMNKNYSTREVYTYKIKQLFTKNDHGKKLPMKNIFGQAMFDVEYISIGGNKGIIPFDKPYKAKWATVDTDNIFEFLGVKYKIDDSVEQYKVKEDNQCEMDKILCYYIPHENKYYFFDMNIYAIPNELIKQV
jgi:hypothetical protein